MCGAANSGRCIGGSVTCAGSRVLSTPTGCRIFVFRGFIIANFLRFGKRFFACAPKDGLTKPCGAVILKVTPGEWDPRRPGAVSRRVPQKLITSKRSNRTLWEPGGYFFLWAAIMRPIIPMITSVYWNSSLYVTIGQPPFRKSGGQEAAPCGGGTRLPYH